MVIAVCECRAGVPLNCSIQVHVGGGFTYKDYKALREKEKEEFVLAELKVFCVFLILCLSVFFCV